MKNLFNSFDNLNGAKFIRINNYLAKTSGEVANHTINVGVSVLTAKETDLNRLKNCTDSDLQMISKASGYDFETCKIALNELTIAAEKNLAKDIADRSAQSQAQTNAFEQLTENGSLKLHKDSLAIHIFGMAINKEVLVKGEYKVVNSSNKTLAKKAIGSHLDLRASKFRTFILSGANSVKLSGETFDINL